VFLEFSILINLEELYNYVQSKWIKTFTAFLHYLLMSELYHNILIIGSQSFRSMCYLYIWQILWMNSWQWDGQQYFDTTSKHTLKNSVPYILISLSACWELIPYGFLVPHGIFTHGYCVMHSVDVVVFSFIYILHIYCEYIYSAALYIILLVFCKWRHT
jgi:hypothetical protein